MQRTLRLLLTLVMMWTAMLPALAQGDVRLNAGDVLQLTVPNEDAFNNPFKIDREGYIELPEVGAVSVAGLMLAQAKAKVRTALAASFRDLGRFDLAIKEHRLLLSVLGFVKQPGQIDIPAGSTAQIAINAAGGLVAGAQLDHVQVRRRGANGQQQIIVFDYKKYLDTGDG